jgi:hydroxymethylpyrimidine kinase/phosphomethylpyrimidine kinase
MTQSIPVALTIAGSDSAGCAGLQADLRTFAALRVHGTSAVTAITAQHVSAVIGHETVSLDMLEKQIDTVLRHLPVSAIKTGMLATAEQVTTLARIMSHFRSIPLVVDPVLNATSGELLAQSDVGTAILDTLLPYITVITPNISEAQHLIGSDGETDTGRLADALFDVIDGQCAVVVKGGHSQDTERCVDMVRLTNGIRFALASPRLETGATRGTGCTFSAAIAARLAWGDPLDEAVRAAKRFISHAVKHGRPLTADGGPVNALWRLEPEEEVPHVRRK